MKMERKKSIKFCLSSIVFILSVACPISFRGTNVQPFTPYTPDSNVDSMIRSVAYEYEMRDKGYKMDCIGTIHLRVALPADIDMIFLEGSTRRQLYPDRISFQKLTSGSDTTTLISQTGAYWDTYFVLRARYKDKSEAKSHIYSVKDYLSKADYEILTAQSFMNDASRPDAKIYALGTNLFVETDEEIRLTVVDLYGKIIFNDIVSQSCTIPLNNISSWFVIVQYQTLCSSETLKIKIK